MRLRRLATWLALIGAVGAALLFVWVRATTPSDGGRVAFYGEAWSTAGVVISPIDAPAAGLEDGDLIAAVNGRSLEAWLGDATDPSILRPDAAVPMPYLIARDGVAERTEVTWVVPAIGGTLLQGWSILLFSVAMAGVAAFVFARRPDEPAATALIFLACGAAGSSVPWFLGVTASDVVQGTPFLLHTVVTGPLYMLLWPAGLHLALVFPTPMPAVTRHRWLIPAAYALAFGMYALATLIGWITAPSLLDWVGTWPIAQTVVVVPFLAVSLALFIRNYRRTTDPAARIRIRWAWLGAAASAAIGLVAFMLPELLVHRTLLPPSWIGLSALPLPLGLAAGILRDRLFDIDVVIRRTFIYGGLTFGVVASYAAVTSAVTAIVGDAGGFGVSLLAAGVAALVALPLRDVLQRAVDRMLYGERDEPLRAMRRLGQRLELAADPDRAFPAIVDTVADALRSPYVALEVDDVVGRSVAVAQRGTPQPAVVTVPLVHGVDRVGSLMIGVRSGERGFRPDELLLLDELARQAGTAVRAMRLRADLAGSRERLVLAREEERRRLRRDIHDGLGPSLASIGLRAEASAELLTTDPEAAKRLLGELSDEVQTTLTEIRRLVDGLRPPALDELGLMGAIRQQASRLEGAVGERPPTSISLVATPDPLPGLPAAVEVAAYRIVVEALTNAVRHAEARTCLVQLTVDEELVIEVDDDGRGLPTRVVAGTGLESMEARAVELGGSLRIDRGRHGGTRLEARLPISGLRVPGLVAVDGAIAAIPS